MLNPDSIVSEAEPPFESINVPPFMMEEHSRYHPSDTFIELPTRGLERIDRPSTAMNDRIPHQESLFRAAPQKHSLPVPTKMIVVCGY